VREKEEGPTSSLSHTNAQTRESSFAGHAERNLSPTAQSVVGLIYKIIFSDISHLYVMPRWLCNKMFANARFDPACASHKNERDRHAEIFLQQPAIMFDDGSPDIILIRSLPKL
jgi:hypothetical protein